MTHISIKRAVLISGSLLAFVGNGLLIRYLINCCGNNDTLFQITENGNKFQKNDFNHFQIGNTTGGICSGSSCKTNKYVNKLKFSEQFLIPSKSLDALGDIWDFYVSSTSLYPEKGIEEILLDLRTRAIERACLFSPLDPCARELMPDVDYGSGYKWILQLEGNFVVVFKLDW